MQFDYRSLDQLKPDGRNPRVHPAAQIEALQASIRAFGFCNPILCDDAGLIIAGHGRHIAAKALGLAEVPVVVLSGLTEPQKRALRIADNKLAQGSSWDPDLLAEELRFLTSDIQIDFNVELTGFHTSEIDNLVIGRRSQDPADDFLPPVPTIATSRVGDVWRLGEHVVGCGDVRGPELLAEIVGESRVDAAFLDPPYNVKIGGFCVGKGRHREFEVASGELSDPAFTAFLKETLGACASVSREGAVHFVCMDHRHVEHLMEAGRSVYGARLNLCFWNKSNAGMGALYRSKHELVGVFRVGHGAVCNTVELGRHGRNRTNVWDYASVNTFSGARREDLKLHPTVKPHALVSDALRDVTRRGDLVLDAFLGSGTTLLACERTGRRFRGLDLDPLYVDLAISRWRDATGEEAVLTRTGESFAQRRAHSLMQEIPFV